VQRWEREQGLPVHRLPHNKQSSVFAYPAEIDRWWDERRVALEADRADWIDADVRPGELDADTAAVGDRDAAPRVRRLRGLGLSLVAAALVVGVVWMAAAYSDAADAAESRRLYQEGRVLWKQRTPAGFTQALAHFEASLAADTENAQALSGLADTYSLLEAFGVMAAADALPKAHTAAAKAVEIAPDLGEARASLAMVLWEQNDRKAAMRVMEQAIALDPQYATARHWYALFLQDSGRYQDAVREGKAARALDPQSPVIGSDLAIMLRSAGETAQARALLEDLVLENPTFAGHRVELAEAYRREGQYERALEQMNSAIRLGDVRPPTLARLATLQARNGIPRAALDVARRLRTMHERGEHVAPPAMIEALAAAGDHDSAFRLIADAVEQHQSWIVELVGTSHADVFKGLKKDPRWVRLQPGIDAITARFVKDTVGSRPSPEAK
jgi:tetratricopeptide (TPR) repeat protein